MLAQDTYITYHKLRPPIHDFMIMESIVIHATSNVNSMGGLVHISDQLMKQLTQTS